MLSKRLNAIASLVDSKKVYDVGCDHGLLSIYLALKNHDVMALDIVPYCIERTKENASKYSANIDIRLNDGINNIDIDKDSNIVIAGMGTYTILNILKDKVLANTLIIQSNNNHDILRKKICDMGYYIDKEIVIKDKKIYDVIRFKRGNRQYSDIDYILGFSHNDDYIKKVYKQYLDMYNDIPFKYFIRKYHYKKILSKIRKSLDK